MQPNRPSPSSPAAPSSEAPAGRSDRVWVTDLRKGDRVRGSTFLVEASNFKQTRNQKFFIQMSLRDRTGAIRAVRWEATEALYRSFSVDDFVLVDGRVEEFQQHPQLIVDSIAPIAEDDVDFGDFLPTSRLDIDEMFRALRSEVDGLRDRALRQLLTRLLDDREIAEGLRRCPAGKSLHHAFVGGLLEHILSLVRLARSVAALYPALDEDLLVTACVVHDIGKLGELGFTRNFNYTDEGQLLGHIALGMEMVRAKADTIDAFPRSRLLEVQHIIASHHGVPEYGALKLPMTREAIVFHYLDNLDAKMSTIDTIEAEARNFDLESTPLGLWSDYKPHLSRKLFFPHRRPGPEEDRR